MTRLTSVLLFYTPDVKRAHYSNNQVADVILWYEIRDPLVETATTVQFYLSLMPYLSCPAPDITYHLINASPVGTGEQLLDGLSNNKKRRKRENNYWMLMITTKV